MKHDNSGSAQASWEDICNSALEHYRKISSESLTWCNTIEKAIEFYKKHGKHDNSQQDVKDKDSRETKMGTIGSKMGKEDYLIALQAFYLKWKHEIDAMIRHCKVMLRRDKEGIPKDSQRDYLVDKKSFEHTLKYYTRAYHQIRKLIEDSEKGSKKRLVSKDRIEEWIKKYDKELGVAERLYLYKLLGNFVRRFGLEDSEKTVSKEFIIKYRSRIPLHISSYHAKPVKEILSCADIALTLMLEELGYKVEEK